MALNAFTFAGTASSTYEAIVLSLPNAGRPERRVSTVEIPGRDGILHIDELTYKEKKFKIPFMAPTSKDSGTIAKWLSGYGVLTTSRVTGKYYKARCDGEVMPEYRYHDMIYYAPEFVVEPFMYVTGEADVTLTGSGTYANAGDYQAAPKIVVTGSGDITLTIGSQNVVLEDISSSITLDSETALCYTGSTAMDAHMTGDFPALVVGNNAISWTGTVSSVTITPRTRYFA